MYVPYLAWRYTVRRPVNLVAILTIALCVLVQIVVMAVLDGMLDDYRRRIRGLGEQIALIFPAGANDEQAFDQVRKALEDHSPIIGVAPVLERYVVLFPPHRAWPQPAILRGIDPAAEAAHGRLPEYLLDIRPGEAGWFGPGGAQEAPASATSPETQTGDDEPGILLGDRLAESLGLQLGRQDRLLVRYYDPRRDRVVSRRFRLLSRFRSGISHFDKYYAYVRLPVAQEAFVAEGQQPVTYAAVWLDDPTLAGPELHAVAQEVLASARRATGTTGFRTITAEDAWESAFRAMAHENALMEVVMALISLSSGFAIFAIVYMLVAARVRDLGVLRSLGASRRGLVLIFSLAGLMMGLFGAAAGALGGVALAPHVSAVWEAFTGQPLYPPHLFGVEELPVRIVAWKVIARSLAAVALAVGASLPLALWAGWRPPLEALRHE